MAARTRLTPLAHISNMRSLSFTARGTLHPRPALKHNFNQEQELFIGLFILHLQTPKRKCNYSDATRAKRQRRKKEFSQRANRLAHAKQLELVYMRIVVKRFGDHR